MQTIPVVRIVVDFIWLLLLWIPIPIIFVHAVPYERGFYCSDTSIRYPFRMGTVSSTMLYTVGAILPIVTILAVEGYRIFVLEPRVFNGGERVKPRYTLMGRVIPPYVASLYFYLGYFFFGMAIDFLITDLGKYSIGRLRPHFVDVCKPNLTMYCSQDPYAYIPPDALVCTGKPSKVRAARLSFPSGHSSFSAYTMVYMTLYLQARMIWPVCGLLTKHVYQFVSLMLAVGTALSRISDYKHHWSDALSGFVLGTVVAFVTAYTIAGFFRRPENIFARPGPYDTRQYTGGQLFGDFAEIQRLHVDGGAADGKEMA